MANQISLGVGLNRRTISERASTLQPQRRPSLHLTKSGVVAHVIVATLILVASLGPAIVSTDPFKQSLRDRLVAPVFLGGSWAHPLGTDQLGRDILARIVEGARASLLIGVTATVLAGIAGISLGLAAGYLGGRTDKVVTFFADVQMALPFVVVAIGVVAVLGNSTRNVIAVLAVTGWVGYTRVVRLQASTLRHAMFIDAARVAGASRWRVMGRHIMPNVLGPVIVIASQQVAGMILYEAALSYLGLGVSSETITWGGMVADGRETLLSAWWVSTLPGVAIAVTILGMYLYGDWLQERLTPNKNRR